ncbi:MAG: hypothetical protein AAF830_17470 [Pseudomonadota bacterium]
MIQRGWLHAVVFAVLLASMITLAPRADSSLLWVAIAGGVLVLGVVWAIRAASLMNNGGGSHHDRGDQ